MTPELTLFDTIQAEVRPIGRFHNTIDLKEPELKQRVLKNDSQTRKILDFFRAHEYENFTPWEVRKAMNLIDTPITSIRRAISDLTEMDYLVKLDGKEGRPLVQRLGEYKELNFTWRLK